MKLFTKAESEILEYALSKVIDRDDALYLEELHGFLFGLAVTPEPVMPSEWFPEVFGPDGPKFDDEKEAQSCLQPLMVIYNRFISESNKGKLRFPFNYDKLNEDDFALIEGWTYGLFLALCLRPHLWGVSDEYDDVKDEDLPPGLIDVIDACEVITAVALPEERDEILETLPGHPPKTDEEIEDLLYGMLPVCVQMIQEYGDGLRKERLSKLSNSPNASAPFATKVGRNDLCPCGSGRKYKKCCGAN